MKAGLLLQYLVIALALFASLWVVARSQFPNAVRRLRMALAVPMLHAGRPAWLQLLGRCLAPSPTKSTGNCSGCDNCGKS